MKKLKLKGDKFTILRLKKGWTLSALAIEVGVHHGTLSRIENCQTTVRPGVAAKICKTLETEFDDLFEIIDVRKGAK